MSEKMAFLNALDKAEAEGKNPNAAVTEAMNAVAETDDGPEFVASLDEEGLANFLDADEEPAQYGCEAIPDDAGQSGMSLVEQEDTSDDWATY